MQAGGEEEEEEEEVGNCGLLQDDTDGGRGQVLRVPALCALAERVVRVLARYGE